MSVLRVKNERLEKLCRALHKGGKVTANDVEQVTTNAYCFFKLVVFEVIVIAVVISSSMAQGTHK